MKNNNDQLREALRECVDSHYDFIDDGGNECIAFDSDLHRKAYHQAAQAHLRLLDGIEGLYDDCQTRCVEDMLQGLARNKALDDVMKLMEE